MGTLVNILISGSVIGLCGFLSVIPILLYQTVKKQSITLWIILLLMIASFLHTFVLPFLVAEEMNEKWIFSEWGCAAKEVASHLSYYVFIFLLVILAIDRFITIRVKSSRFLRLYKSSMGGIAIAFIAWGLGVLCTIPMMKYSFKIGEYPNCVCRLIFPSAHQAHISSEDLCSSGDFYDEKACNANLNNPERFCLRNLTLQSRKEEVLTYWDFNNDEAFPFFNDTGFNMDDMESEESNRIQNYYPIDQNENQLPPACQYAYQGSEMTSYIILNFVLYLVCILFCGSVYVYLSLLSKPQKRNRTSRKNKFMLGQTSSISMKETKEENKALNMLSIVLTSAMGFFFFFHHCLHLALFKGIHSVESVCINLILAGTTLVVLYYALNPFIYIGFGIIWPRFLSQTKLRSSRSNVRNRHNFRREN